MYRGALIFPFIAEIARIDTVATAAPVGDMDSGYDPIFRQVRNLAGATQAGTTARSEVMVTVPCQVEGNESERLRQGVTGDSPVSHFKLVLHARDIDSLGLRRADGTIALEKQDRLVRVLDSGGAVQYTFPSPPGLYLHEVLPGEDWGLALIRPRLEVFIVTWRGRDLSR